MRDELLKKEKELLALKQIELDQQIARYKEQVVQVTLLFLIKHSLLCHIVNRGDVLLNEINICKTISLSVVTELQI